MLLYDLVFSFGLLLAILLFIGFLFTLSRSTETPKMKTAWVIIALCVPIIGPICHFIVYRGQRS